MDDTASATADNVDVEELKALLRSLLAEREKTSKELAKAREIDKARQEEERWRRYQERAGTFTRDEWVLREDYDALSPNGGHIQLHPLGELDKPHAHAGQAYCLCHNKLTPLADLVFVRWAHKYGPGFTVETGFMHRDFAKKYGIPEYIVK